MAIQDWSQEEMAQEQKKLDNKYNLIRGEVGSSTMDLISEIVELELEIEAHCNQ